MVFRRFPLLLIFLIPCLTFSQAEPESLFHDDLLTFDLLAPAKIELTQIEFEDTTFEELKSLEGGKQEMARRSLDLARMMSEPAPGNTSHTFVSQSMPRKPKISNIPAWLRKSKNILAVSLPGSPFFIVFHLPGDIQQSIPQIEKAWDQSDSIRENVAKISRDVWEFLKKPVGRRKVDLMNQSVAQEVGIDSVQQKEEFVDKVQKRFLARLLKQKENSEDRDAAQDEGERQKEEEEIEKHYRKLITNMDKGNTELFVRLPPQAYRIVNPYFLKMILANKQGDQYYLRFGTATLKESNSSGQTLSRRPIGYLEIGMKIVLW